MAAIPLPHDWIKYPDGGGFAAAAGGNIVEKYACVKLGATAGTVVETTGVADVGIVGFIKEEGSAPVTGDLVTVFDDGHVWAVPTGVVLAAGVYVTSAANGKIQAAGAGQVICGKTLAAGSGGAGELVPIKICWGTA